MQPFKALCTSEQLAEHLKQEIYRGAFGETMPGSKHLVRFVEGGTIGPVPRARY